MKICRVCKIEKDSHNFYDRETQKGTKYLSSQCRQCTRIRVSNYRKRDHYKSIRKAWNLKSYGITIEEYEKLLKIQNNKCSICKSDDPKRSASTVFSIDHCHTTGKVRGLLCTSCNIILGHARDSVEILQQAINYLNK